MRDGRRWWSALWCVALLVGCDGSAEERVLATLSSVDGTEVARLTNMPMTFDPSLEWVLTPRRDIRSGSPDRPLLYDPSHLLPLRDGTLLIYDPAAPAPLAIIDPATDRLVRRFGRRGQGPGEIGGRVSLGQSDRDGFEILDGGNRQVHRYGPDGEWLHSEPIEVGGWPIDAGRAPDDTGFLLQLLVSEERAWWNELVRVAMDEPSVVRFGRLPPPSADAEPGRLQRGRALWTVTGRHVVSMWSDRPTIEIHDAQGTLERRIELPLSRRTLTESDVAREIARFGAMAANLRPGSAALTNMLYPVSDTVFGMFTSNLWGSAEDPPIPEDVVYWRLFTLRGEYLGFLRQPDDFRFLGNGSGTLWARLLDERLEPRLIELELVRARGSSDY